MESVLSGRQAIPCGWPLHTGSVVFILNVAVRGSFYLHGISRNDNYRLFQQDQVAKHTSALAQANHVEQPQGTPLNSKRPSNLAAGHRQVSNDLQQPTNSRHFQDQVLSTWREDQLTSMFDNRNSCEHLSQEFVGEFVILFVHENTSYQLSSQSVSVSTGRRFFQSDLRPKWEASQIRTEKTRLLNLQYGLRERN